MLEKITTNINSTHCFFMNSQYTLYHNVGLYHITINLSQILVTNLKFICPRQPIFYKILILSHLLILVSG